MLLWGISYIPAIGTLTEDRGWERKQYHRRSPLRDKVTQESQESRSDCEKLVEREINLTSRGMSSAPLKCSIRFTNAEEHLQTTKTV